MKGSIKTIILYLLIFGILMAVCFAFLGNKQNQEKITYGEVIELFKEGKVKEFSINSVNSIMCFALAKSSCIAEIISLTASSKVISLS